MTGDERSLKQNEIFTETIQGVCLTSVQFVTDYLILGFDAKGALTTLVWPEIHTPDTVLRFGMSGYRDTLCELIPHVVKRAETSADETITFVFDNEINLRIPLRDRKEPGEKAISTAPKNRLWVWR